jgi:hypothetical protein
MEVDRDLTHAKLSLRSTDHHLAGEFHAGSFQVQRLNLLAIERSQPAVPVAAWGSVQQSTYTAQDRVTNVAVMPRHRARNDPASKTVAHDKVVALFKLVQKPWDLAKIVAAVAVTHHLEYALEKGN